MWNLKRVIVIALMLVVNVLVIWNIFFQNDTKAYISLCFILFNPIVILFRKNL